MMRNPEELPLRAYAPGWRHGDLPEVRSRRASLVRMLADPRWQKEDFFIFGESDAVPLVEAATLRAALEKELNAHPETHLLRLFHHKSHSPNDPRKVVASLRFSAYQPGRERSKASLYVSGLHAFVVPSVHRKKVADVLCHTPLPPDRALELAAARGTLNIRVAESNLFYQKPRTQRAQAVSESDTTESSIAVCLVVRHLENLDRLLSLYLTMPSPSQVYAYIGGWLNKAHLKEIADNVPMKDRKYYDSCALRLSIALSIQLPVLFGERKVNVFIYFYLLF